MPRTPRKNLERDSKIYEDRMRGHTYGQLAKSSGLSTTRLAYICDRAMRGADAVHQAQSVIGGAWVCQCAHCMFTRKLS